MDKTIKIPTEKNIFWSFLSLAAIFGFFINRVVGFSQHFKPKVLTNNMLTKANYPILVTISLLVLTACTEQKPTINIAVASNFEQTLKRIIQQYPNKQFQINIIPGSSGVLANQIINHAPFDLFLSADSEKTQLVYSHNKLTKKPQVYAIGKLVLWIPNGVNNQNCISQLYGLNTLAIANPKTAPYGFVAKHVINNNNIQVKKLVHTANISQAFLYTKDNLTQAGFVAYSQIGNNTGCQQIFEHHNLRQSMLLIKEDAREIYNYILSPKIQLLIRESGYNSQN